jgi:AraC-like DNA-binding protein
MPEVMLLPTRLVAHRMILVTQGEGKLCFDGNMINIARGNLIFGFEGENLFMSEIHDTVYMYVDFSGTRASELFSRFNINRLCRCFGGFDGIIPFWEENLSRASESTLDLTAESLLLHAFSRLNISNGQFDDLINQVIEITEERFTDADLSLAVIANELSYNAKYLSHQFKQKAGVNYSEYLRSVRIRYAVSLFDRGLYSIKNVALLSGFSDPLYFSNVFKKSMGYSPKEYISIKNQESRR